MSHQNDRPRQELLTSTDAAELLGVSRSHFYRMHRAECVPPPVRLGGVVRWRLSELKDWIDAGMPDRPAWIAQGGGHR